MNNKITSSENEMLKNYVVYDMVRWLLLLSDLAFFVDDQWFDEFIVPTNI